MSLPHKSVDVNSVRRRLGFTVGVIFTVAALFAGCGGSDSSSNQSASGEDPAGSAEALSAEDSEDGSDPAPGLDTEADTATSPPITDGTGDTAGTGDSTGTGDSAEAETVTPESTNADEASAAGDEASSPADGTEDHADPPPQAITPPVVPAPEASTLQGLLELGRPLVIAHAGGDQDYPHSTLYAYTQSALAGADILELDVMLTADGELIVQHDDTVDRTTEVQANVADLTLAEIKALDNAYWFVAGHWGDQTRPDEEYVFRGVRTGMVEPPEGFSPDDFSVATFTEVALRFPDHVLDVEVKLQRGADGEEDPASGVAAAQVLAEEIAELGREDSVVVASFNDEVLAAFRELAPGVAVSPGYNDMLGWYLADAPLDPVYRVLQVPETFEGVEVVTPELVAKIRAENRYMWVWLSGTGKLETVDFYADLLARGVNGVIAGRPALAVEALTAN